MILGIDVGGTYSDAVLISGKRILNRIKIKTNRDNLMQSILEIRDKLDLSPQNSPEKIIVSTTLMTNFITEKKYKNTGLLLIPGPGMKYTADFFPFPFEIVKGGVDFQGRIIERLDKNELLEKVESLSSKGVQKLSINCKFAPRNPVLESEAKEIIAKEYPGLILEKGTELTGSLNIIRRAISSGLKLASQEIFRDFLLSLNSVFYFCPNIHVLKSDGGSVPVDLAEKYSVETIFSGPAASSFGALALLKDADSAVVIDIGGTTSDYSLILNKEPLFSTKGIKINNFYTTARGISVSSLPLGGDTKVEVESDDIHFTFRKTTPAMEGGADLTISDCLCFLDKIEIGDKEMASAILEKKANILGLQPEDLAEKILDSAAAIISENLSRIIKMWENEPKYRVWQIENQFKIHPEQIYLIGGPAKGFAPFLEKKIKTPVIVDEGAMTANALGAALAKSSFNSYIRINTSKNEINTGWGYYGKTDFPRKAHPEVIKKYCMAILKNHLKSRNIYEEPLIFEHEIFSMVKGGFTEGQIHELQVGLPTGINLDLLPLEGGK